MKRITILAACLAMVVAGCGDDSSQGTKATPTTAPTTVAPTTAPPTTAVPTTAAPTTSAPPTTMGEEHHEDGEHEHEVRPGESIPPPEGEVTSEIEVVMTEFAFEPDVIDLTPGETVRFVIHNDGVVEHEFRLTTVHRAAEHIESGHEGHDDEGGHHGEMDIVILVAAGETRVVEATLPADAEAIDHLACLIPGHYEAGMLGSVDY